MGEIEPMGETDPTAEIDPTALREVGPRTRLDETCHPRGLQLSTRILKREP
jgi:hypothetical protein